MPGKGVSSYIPSIKAKPVIDLLVVVKSIDIIDPLTDALSQQGYVSQGEHGIPGRRFFYKGEIVRTHHLHVYPHGHAEIERHVLLVDYLNGHYEKAKEYERLKIALAGRYKNSPDAYCEGKTGLVRRLERDAFAWKGTGK